MSDEPEKPDTDVEDEDRAAILARRNRFVRAALTGIAGASIVAACGGDTADSTPDAQPQPCLKMAQEGGAFVDATPQPCLSPIQPDTGSPDDAADADDGNVDAPPDAAPDAIPQPCLSPLPPDASNDG